MQTIMIIRHAEKPGDADPDHGVTANGVHDKHELTVRGWQRAGALVRYFAPWGAPCAHEGIVTPRALYASVAEPGSPSLRAQRTVEPLAAALGITVDLRFANGEEVALAAAVLAEAEPVLIAWHHNHIALLARCIAGSLAECPPHWPDDRFDVVWVLSRPEAQGAWRFGQVPQRLLAGDRPTGF